MRQLEGEPLLLMNESFHLYHDFMSLCAVQGVRPNVVAKTADGAGLYRLCSRKVGLAVAPEFFREEFSHGRGPRPALRGGAAVGGVRGLYEGDGELREHPHVRPVSAGEAVSAPRLSTKNCIPFNQRLMVCSSFLCYNYVK